MDCEEVTNIFYTLVKVNLVEMEKSVYKLWMKMEQGEICPRVMYGFSDKDFASDKSITEEEP